MSEHILVIDAGNTRIKWGVHNGDAWLTNGAVATAEIAGNTPLRDALLAYDVDQIVVSNVAGHAVAHSIAEQVRSCGKSAHFVVASAGQCGVTSHYDQPARLGADRWAALIAAQAGAAAIPHPQLVVMAGTALTVDTLTADGQFLGGIIVPGVRLMQAALNSGTAELPLTQGNYQTFPTNTANAIASGVIEASVGAIARMYTHMSTSTGDAPRCLASGGAMRGLAAHLPFPVLINDNLVLDGLLVIARSNRSINQRF